MAGRLQRIRDANGVITGYVLDGQKYARGDINKKLKELFLGEDPWARQAIEGLDDFRALRPFLPQWKQEIRKGQVKAKGGISDVSEVGKALAERQTLQERLLDIGDSSPAAKRAIEARIAQIDSSIERVAPPASAGQTIADTMEKRRRRQRGETPVVLPKGPAAPVSRDSLDPQTRQLVAQNRPSNALGRVVQRGAVGVAEGLFTGTQRFLPREWQRNLEISRMAAAPESRVEDYAGFITNIAGNIVGFVAGPGKVLTPLRLGASARLVARAPKLAAFSSESLLKLAGPKFAGAAPVIRNMAAGMGDGAVFSFIQSAFKPELYRKVMRGDELGAVMDVVKDAAKTSAQWGAVAGSFTAGGMAVGKAWKNASQVVRAIRARQLTAADARRAMDPALQAAKTEVLGPVMTRVSIPASRVDQQAVAVAADSVDAVYLSKITSTARKNLILEGPNGERAVIQMGQPVPPLAYTPGYKLYPVERASFGSVADELVANASAETLRAKTRGLRGTGTSPREQGTNPRAVREAAERQGVDLKKLHEDERGSIGRTVRFYHGEGGAMAAGATGDWWTTNPQRARSYGANVRAVDVPLADAQQYMDAARQAGSGTGGDAILPQEFFNRARPVAIRPSVFDLLTGQLRNERGAFGRVGPDPGALLKPLESTGAAYLGLGVTRKAQWMGAMQQYVDAMTAPGAWEKLAPQTRELLWERASAVWQGQVTRQVYRSALRQFARNYHEAAVDPETGMKAGAEWYPALRRTLRSLFGDTMAETDMEAFVAMLAIASQDAGTTAVPLAVKAFMQHKMGLPIKGVRYGAVDQKIQRFLNGEPLSAIAGPKVHNFVTGFRDNLPEENSAILQGAARFIQTRNPADIVYSVPENAVTVDMQHLRQARLSPRQVAAMTNQQVKAAVGTAPSEAEYALISEEFRLLARQETFQRWVQATADNPAVTPDHLMSIRVTPRDAHAVSWVGWKDEVNKQLAHMGKRTFTSDDYAIIMQQRPDLQLRIQLALSETRPSPFRDGADLQRMLETERWVVIGTNPRESLASLTPEQLTKVLKLRPGEDNYIATIREFSEFGLSPEEVFAAQDRWFNPAKNGLKEERSLFVRVGPGASFERLIKLARARGQQWVMSSDGLIDLDTGVVNRAVGIKMEPIPDGHTILKTASGNVPFSAVLKDPVPGDIHPDVFPARRRQLQLIGSEAGATTLFTGGVPGLSDVAAAQGIVRAGERKALAELTGFAKAESGLEFRYDPVKGFVAEGANAADPTVRAWSEYLAGELQQASFRNIIQGGAPLTAGATAKVVPGKNGYEVVTSWVRAGEEFSRAVKLTNPLTHERNLSMNTLVSLVFQPLEKFTAGSLDAARSLITRTPRQVYATEAFADLYGKFAAIPDAFASFVRAMAHENYSGKFAEGRGTAIPGKVGQAIRLPFRFLRAADELGREINRRGNLYSLAYREALNEGAKDLPGRIAELVVSPTEKMAKDIKRLTSEYLFQDELGQTAQLISSAINSVPGGGFIVPFIKTPINVTKFFFRRSPLGLATVAESALRGGGAAEMEERLAKVAVGSLGLLSFGLLARRGLITGDGPTNPKMTELLYAQGWQPRSFRAGDKWISYRGFEPIASFMALAADAVEGFTDEGTATAGLSRAAMAMGRMLEESTFVDQTNTLLDIIVDPDGRKIEKFLANTIAGGIIPRVVSAVGQQLDPTVRDPQSFAERLKLQLPGLSEEVRPKLDIYGQPIVREGTPFAPRWSSIKDDPLAAELYRLKVGLPKVSKSKQVKGEPVERGWDEILRIAQARGGRYKDMLTRLISSSQWAAIPDDRKKRILERYIGHITARAR